MSVIYSTATAFVTSSSLYDFFQAEAFGSFVVRTLQFTSRSTYRIFFENISISNRHNKNLRAILAGNVIESSARKLPSVPMDADRHLNIKRESF